MNIVFPPVDESYIKTKVEDGFYSNATELVRDAVRRLRELDDQKYLRLRGALDLGEQAIREGRTVTYTSQTFDQIEADARRHAAAGGACDPDVLP